MKVINVRNVQHALPEGIELLLSHGVRKSSRAGDVMVNPTPVTTVYENPTERVMFWKLRDANPFFHLMESLWMLAGRNDVKYPASFVATMKNFSDDGETFHGAYGHRWIKHFGFDQLELVINALRENPDDRRQVVQMWDANVDLGKQGKDFPCNTQIFFSVTRGKLDMTVVNRSNDMIWGAYGANAVHFSVLQEYMAFGIGVPVGTYYQVSNNYHAYVEIFEKMSPLVDFSSLVGFYRTVKHCPYACGTVEPFPLIQTDIESWKQDLKLFLEYESTLGFVDPFFTDVASPVSRAYSQYKLDKTPEGINIALSILQDCKATDWKLACEEWLKRRLEKAIAKLRAEDDGVSYE